jgi:hypothetical protein
MLTCTRDMWKDNAHGTSVKDLLHEAITALVWHSDKRRYAYIEPCNAKITSIVEGQR